MKCPHNKCTGKIDTTIMKIHAESYGGSISKVVCPKCKRGVEVLSEVVVKFAAQPYYGPATHGSWGGDIPENLPVKMDSD